MWCTLRRLEKLLDILLDVGLCCVRILFNERVGQCGLAEIAQLKKLLMAKAIELDLYRGLLLLVNLDILRTRNGCGNLA